MNNTDVLVFDVTQEDIDKAFALLNSRQFDPFKMCIVAQSVIRNKLCTPNNLSVFINGMNIDDIYYIFDEITSRNIWLFLDNKIPKPWTVTATKE